MKYIYFMIICIIVLIYITSRHGDKKEDIANFKNNEINKILSSLKLKSHSSIKEKETNENSIGLGDLGIFSNRIDEDEQPKELKKDTVNIFEDEENKSVKNISLLQQFEMKNVGSENKEGEGIAVDYNSTFQDVGKEDSYGDAVAVDIKMLIQDVGQENEYGDAVAIKHELKLVNIGSENQEGEGIAVEHTINFDDVIIEENDNEKNETF